MEASRPNGAPKPEFPTCAKLASSAMQAGHGVGRVSSGGVAAGEAVLGLGDGQDRSGPGLREVPNPANARKSKPELGSSTSRSLKKNGRRPESKSFLSSTSSGLRLKPSTISVAPSLPQERVSDKVTSSGEMPPHATSVAQDELRSLTNELAQEVMRHRSAIASLRSSSSTVVPQQTVRIASSTSSSSSLTSTSSANPARRNSHQDGVMDGPQHADEDTRNDSSLMTPRQPGNRRVTKSSRRLSIASEADDDGCSRLSADLDRESDASSVISSEDQRPMPRSLHANQGNDASSYGTSPSSPFTPISDSEHANSSNFVQTPESTARVFLSEADGNQSFFLHAVFDLVKAKLDWEMQVLESLRIKYPELPASNEAIMYGHLRKGKGINIRSKFVVVSPGLMTYLTSSAAPGMQESSSSLPSSTSSMASPLVLFGKNTKDKREPVKTMRLHPGLRCRPIEKKHGRFAFEIIDPMSGQDASASTRLYGASVVEGSETRNTDARIWVASSEDERIRWMRVIEDAANLETRMEHESAVEVKRLNELHMRVSQSHSPEEYLESLGKVFGLNHLNAAQLICELEPDSDENGSISPGGSSLVDYIGDEVPVRGSKRIDVPVAWVHDKLKLPRGGIAHDSTMMQILKDMQRDTIVINDKTFEGHSELIGKRSAGSSGSFASPAVCAIICAIAREIQRNSIEVDLTEAEALELAHQVLMTCNRTQSGGNTLDAVSVLCASPEYSFVAADTSVPTQPLRIRVYSAPRLQRAPTPEDQTGRRSSLSSQHTEGKKSRRSSVRRHRAISQPQSRNQKEKPSSASKEQNQNQITTTQSSSAFNVHRKTSSDGDYSAALEGLDIEGNSSESKKRDILESQTSSASSAHSTPVKNPSHTDFRLSLSKLRHRRRASEPLQLDFPLSSSALADSGGVSRVDGESLDLHTAPRVDICVVMHYKLCNANFQDETDAVWARVRAKFRRTFALVGQRKTVALGQGMISLTLLKKTS